VRLTQTIQLTTARLTLEELRNFVEQTAHIAASTTVAVRADSNQRDPYVQLTVTL